MSPSPTRITTAEELDALPKDTVLRDRLGNIAVRADDPELTDREEWGIAGLDGSHDRFAVLTLLTAPVTVLHDPAAPSVSDTAAATITPEEYEQAYYAAAEVLRRIDVEPALAMNKFWYASRATDAVLAALGLTVTDKAEE